ncbi:efflux RND transporter periplasmic adaptor subunit [Treponema sp.]|uniref:efflux RND transporter periplasmic adaptor subunit n=1 Tax=Treponema sp. TaxID=166 RepID=UPI0025F2C518|nr:efflux RND transporter periplasmic adaptor subunit [Treponema sp.]MCR5218620.1 efflux RND transporter periplasmic adaptor subunit [Treponema sp.]
MKATKPFITGACTIAIAAILIIYALNAKSDGTAMGPGGKKGAFQTLISVKTQVLEKETLHDYVIANGEVEAQNSVSVYPDTAGKITSTKVMLGSEVKKGDVIATIDPTSPGSYYKESPVYAPISGSIISSPLKNGTTVSTSTEIAVIGDIAKLQITASIPERYVAVLKTGLKADVSVEAYPGITFAATVKYVSPVVDATSRTKEVILTFDKYDSRINAGMFAKIKLYTQDYSDCVTMPEDSLVQNNDKYYAYVVKEDDTVEKREIDKGNSVDGTVQITSGLAEGERVVVQGQTSLSDGAKIRDVEAKKEVPAENDKDIKAE